MSGGVSLVGIGDVEVFRKREGLKESWNKSWETSSCRKSRDYPVTGPEQPSTPAKLHVGLPSLASAFSSLILPAPMSSASSSTYMPT